MKRFEGTPGPWAVDWSDFVVVSKDGKGIADFDYGRFDDDEDCKNANLIAAAPDLLEALQELVFLYEHDEGCRELTEYKRAKAAISKALGEE